MNEEKLNRQVYHSQVLLICALLFGQTEGILEKYCILAQSEAHFWLTL